MLGADPHSAAVLTAEAEVQLRQGSRGRQCKCSMRPKRGSLLCARPFDSQRRVGIDSMYASERAEIQRAYEMDPTNPDI